MKAGNFSAPAAQKAARREYFIAIPVVYHFDCVRYSTAAAARSLLLSARSAM